MTCEADARIEIFRKEYYPEAEVVFYVYGARMKAAIEYPEQLDEPPYWCNRAALDAYDRGVDPGVPRLDWSEYETDPEAGLSMPLRDFLEAARAIEEEVNRDK